MIAEIFLITALVATVLYVISGFYLLINIIIYDDDSFIDYNLYLLAMIVYCFLMLWINGDVS